MLQNLINIRASGFFLEAHVQCCAVRFVVIVVVVVPALRQKQVFFFLDETFSRIYFSVLYILFYFCFFVVVNLARSSMSIQATQLNL